MFIVSLFCLTATEYHFQSTSEWRQGVTKYSCQIKWGPCTMTVTYGRIRNCGCTRPDLFPFIPTSKCDQRHAYVLDLISVNLRWLPQRKKKPAAFLCT